MPEAPHILVVAAGRGSRAGAGLPKQFRALAGEPVITRTLRSLLSASEAVAVTPVIHPDDAELFRDAAALLPAALRDRIEAPAHGGRSRQESVRLGLETVASRSGTGPDLMLIHDGARPFVSAGLVDRALAAARHYGAAIPGLPVTDTVKTIDPEGAVAGTPDRHLLRAVQTPQAFAFPLILESHRRAAVSGRSDLTDDAAVAEYAGHKVHVFEGDPDNVKITTAADFSKAEAAFHALLPDIRIGQGYDVHSFEEGDHVWLGGVRIAHDRKLNGHSDADVLLHALTDAILGAIGDGDIGVHFPPSQEQWRGASSDLFLRDAVARVTRRGGIVAHLDATLVCEAPKIGPHREAMRARIAAIAGIAVERVGLKATTSEMMGFVGRREGMAAWGLATVRLPFAGPS